MSRRRVRKINKFKVIRFIILVLLLLFVIFIIINKFGKSKEIVNDNKSIDVGIDNDSVKEKKYLWLWLEII